MDKTSSFSKINNIHRSLALISLYAGFFGASAAMGFAHTPIGVSNYMVFSIGTVALGFYLFFAARPILFHVVTGYFSLWMLLVYHTPGWLFYGATLLVLLACVQAIRVSGFKASSKLLLLAAGIAFCIAGVLLHRAFAFMLTGLYLTLHAAASPGASRHKLDVLVVDLLILMAAIGSLWRGEQLVDQSIRYNLVFTVPVSAFVYLVLIRNRTAILNHLFLLLQPKQGVFLCFQVNVFLFSVTSKLPRSGSALATISLFAGGIMLFGLWFLYAAYAGAKQREQTKQLKENLEVWFSEKWELALSQHQREFSWSGFETRLAEVFPNDGIAFTQNDRRLFASGCFLQQDLPPNAKQIQEGESRLMIHASLGHQEFSLDGFYMAFAAAAYLREKTDQWDVMKSLRVLGENDDFVKDLQFRKDVTYFLHDNILQNIIATKNIVAILPTEQAALQGLAVETLSELNDSIRTQMFEIYPSTLTDLPFERNIHILLDEMKKKFTVLPQFHIQYTLLEKLDEEYRYFFYRAMQELLANSSKHAHAENVWLEMYWDEGYVLAIADDGIPFPAEMDFVKIKHLGLSSIRQQAIAFGGEFELAQQSDRKVMKVTLPRRENENTVV